MQHSYELPAQGPGPPRNLCMPNRGRAADRIDSSLTSPK